MGLSGVAVIAVAALMLSGCASDPARGGGAPGAETDPQAAGHPAPSPDAAREIQGPAPRLVLTHAGGITVLDAASLEVVGRRTLTASTGSTPRGMAGTSWSPPEASSRSLMPECGPKNMAITGTPTPPGPH
jgi:hypothetical protein